MAELFVEGMLFDGSSIAGFVGINESDRVLKPDIHTYSRSVSYTHLDVYKRQPFTSSCLQSDKETEDP